jgi:hypothetical protein
MAPNPIYYAAYIGLYIALFIQSVLAIIAKGDSKSRSTLALSVLLFLLATAVSFLCLLSVLSVIYEAIIQHEISRALQISDYVLSNGQDGMRDIQGTLDPRFTSEAAILLVMIVAADVMLVSPCIILSL